MPLGAGRAAIGGLNIEGLRRPPMIPRGDFTISTVASEPGQTALTTTSAFARTCARKKKREEKEDT